MLTKALERNSLALSLSLESPQAPAGQLQHQGVGFAGFPLDRWLAQARYEGGRASAGELRLVVAASQRQKPLEIDALRTRSLLERAPAELAERERDLQLHTDDQDPL